MTIEKCFTQQCSFFEKTLSVRNTSNQKLQPKTRWVIALSGGLDSMVVLDLAHRLLPANQLVAIHINHQQQDSADQWQSFCKQQCLERNIAYYPFTISPQGSSEQVLRDARYQIFSEFLDSSDCLLFGHHADDQAETVIFRLIRGAGSKGLSAMPVSRVIGAAQLLRPLLSVNKKSLISYAQNRKLQWVEDPSNQSLDYDRNYIRHEITAPMLEHWPNASEQIAVSAQLVADDHQLLNQYLAMDVDKISDDQCLDLTLWSAYPELQRKALLRYWAGAKSNTTVSRKQLQRIVNEVIFAQADSSGYCQLGNYVLRRFAKKLYIISSLAKEEAWPLIDPSQHRYRLVQGVLLFGESKQGVELLDGMYLQSKTTGLSIKVANRPRKKLKKLFQEHEVAPWLRDHWPIIMYQDEIVAIPGIGISEAWLSQDENKSLFYPQWDPL